MQSDGAAAMEQWTRKTDFEAFIDELSSPGLAGLDEWRACKAEVGPPGVSEAEARVRARELQYGRAKRELSSAEDRLACEGQLREAREALALSVQEARLAPLVFVKSFKLVWACWTMSGTHAHT